MLIQLDFASMICLVRWLRSFSVKGKLGMFAPRLVGWLADSLFGWFGDWLVGSLDGCLVGWLVGRLKLSMIFLEASLRG